jgi:predicted transcriptional regulator of viral defense system/very-short-patch-repair endonuclease
MHDKTRTHAAVAELAGRQYGVVSGRQLATRGWTRSRVSDATIAGRLHRVHQGVYAVGHPGVSPHGRCLAAVLAGGDGALLSHYSAAWLWGLLSGCGTVIDVTAPLPRHSRDGICVHSADGLHAEDRSSSEGIPVTAVPKTLLDLAAASERNLSWAMSRAKHKGLLDLIAIDALIDRNTGRAGVKRLRLAMAEYREPAFTRSGLERRFLRLVREAGLPRPSMNLFVANFELDAYWPSLRFAVELDTYDYHGGRREFEADRLRQEDLKLVGIEMTRVTGARITADPDAVAKRLRRLFDQRRRELQHRPIRQ